MNWLDIGLFLQLSVAVVIGKRRLPVKNLLVALALMASGVVSGSATASQCPYYCGDVEIDRAVFHIFMECDGEIIYHHPWLQ